MLEILQRTTDNRDDYELGTVPITRRSYKIHRLLHRHIKRSFNCMRKCLRCKIRRITEHFIYLPNLRNMCRYDHKISMRETDHDVTVSVPAIVFDFPVSLLESKFDRVRGVGHVVEIEILSSNDKTHLGKMKVQITESYFMSSV